MTCKHETLAPKKHPDGPVAPACTDCGKFVVRGELHIVIEAPNFATPPKGAMTRG